MSSFRSYNLLSGFTLIEIMMVLAIISILAVVGVANFSDSSASARDTQRQSDLKNLQNAIETYHSQNGRYPVGCAVGVPANGWSGQLATNYACTDGMGQYIVGLAPEYISVLPTDPRLNGIDSGYIYRTNAEGTVYKLKAHKTVESEVVTRDHPLKACDIRVQQNLPGAPKFGSPAVNASRNPKDIGWCAAISDGVNFTYPETDCNENTDSFRSSYSVSGGLAPLYDGGNNAYGLDLYAADPLEVIKGVNLTQKNIRRFYAIHYSTDVICK